MLEKLKSVTYKVKKEALKACTNLLICSEL